MAEGVESKDVFYVNGSFVNNSEYPQLASVLVSDDRSILERTEGYTVTITRFSVDTQSNMFFIEKDDKKRVCVELLNQRLVTQGGINKYVWDVDRRSASH